MRHAVRRTTCLAALVLAIVPAVASAAAPPRTVRLISGGSLSLAATGVGMSADGSRSFFTTTEALLPADTNGVTDVYGRDVDGTLQLVSSGTGAAASSFAGASANGNRVWYSTNNADVAGDIDASNDVYERRRDGGLRQITGGNAATTAFFVEASDSGDHVLFSTTEAVPGTGDSDGLNDIYDRRGDNSIRLVTPSTAVSVFAASSAALSADGERALFSTTESLVAGDVDAAGDVYSVTTTTGVYALLTPGTTGSFSTFGDRTGRRAWFTTTEALVAADTDTARDVYETVDGTYRLISGGTANVDSNLETTLEANGSVYFSTTEKLLPADGDATGLDIYERRADSSLRLISGGATDLSFASVLGVAPDGAVTIYTDDTVLPADTDAESDLYLRRADGSVLLLTPGTPGFFSISYYGAQVPVARTRFTFVTNLVLDPADTNAATDMYEVTNDGLRMLVAGVPGGTSLAPGESADGSRVLFSTASTIPGTGDGDTATDVYEADIAVPDAAGVPTLAGNGKVGAIHTCTAPAITGENLTVSYAWLRDATPIVGAAAATYKPVAADAGHNVRCRITARNPIGSDTADSAPRGIPPVARLAKLAGYPIVGTNLTCTTFLGATTTKYAWKRGTKAVKGRTAKTYKVAKSDLGKRLTCTATGKAGALASTANLAVTVPKQCTVPSVRGLTPAAAQTKLGNAGCRSKISKVKGSGVKKGLVLGTSPAKRTKKPNGTKITIKVRK